MIDYRQPQHRRDYFTRLYELNLTRGIMPGLVYLYMPALAERYNWDDEQRLWFAFLNGLTQNPITSLRLFQQLPEVPPAHAPLTRFEQWFNDNWETLQFDTDRRYQKKDTVDAIKLYAPIIATLGSQKALFQGHPFSFLWESVRHGFHSFGRLSAFSYLEYIYLNGFGADCDNLHFDDKSGSKSHRNGMMFLLGQDQYVWDKRMPNGFDGTYPDFKKMCEWLDSQSVAYLANFRITHPNVQHVGKFTLESNLCTFKNHFFGRRYPGVYADMAQERIEWADERGQQDVTAVFKDIRAGLLPEWLRCECEPERLTLKQKAKQFADTGYPYRGEHFL
jgi:hypothetical protein